MSAAETATNIMQHEWETVFGGPECFETHKGRLMAAYDEAFTAHTERGYRPEEAHEHAKIAVRELIESEKPTIKSVVTLERFRNSAKARFMASGGSESEFLSSWPEIRAQYLRQQAMNPNVDTDSEARRQAKRIW